MRKFFLLVICLITLNSLVLGLYFNYGFTTVFYHVLMMAATLVVLQGMVLLAAAFIRQRKPFRIAIHTLCFGYLFGFVLLYIAILASNYFWKKTIMFSIIRNYFSKIGNFVAALPVQGWLFYSASVLIGLMTVVLYFFFSPDSDRTYDRLQPFREKKNFPKILIGTGVLLVLLVVLRTPLLHIKRTFQFKEEPVTQFFLGSLWGQGNEMAFDKKRYILGQKDKACFDSLRVAPLAGDRTVVVIVLDALRSDHLPMYGYSRNTTPFLDSLYNEGDLLRIQHAFSPSTSTVGGVAGLFYSRDWTAFGYNGLNIMKYLKKANYTTYAFLTGYHRDWFGLSALYRGSNDYYYESPKDPNVPPDDDMVTIEKIWQTPLSRRSFIYIHLLSTHTIGKKDPAFQRFLPNKMGFGVDQKTALENNYDNGILQADAVVRQVFQKLEKENLLQNCTVFLTADHGELFGEEGQWSHGGSVHPKLLSVPLLIYDQQLDWYKNLQVATLKDLAPTIVDRLGYPVPACWEGRSLRQPPHNFILQIDTALETDEPYGLLHVRDSLYRLQVLNKKKQVQRTWTLSNETWIKTNELK